MPLDADGHAFERGDASIAQKDDAGGSAAVGKATCNDAETFAGG